MDGSGMRPNSSCTGTTYSTVTGSLIPSNGTVGIATYKAGNGTLEKDRTWRAMETCCSPSTVNKLDSDCVLWCDLSDEYTSDRERFFDCLNSNHRGSGTGHVRDPVNNEEEGGDSGGVVARQLSMVRNGRVCFGYELILPLYLVYGEAKKIKMDYR